MVLATQLSWEQAVTLSAELGEVAERLRALETKYQLQHAHVGGPWYQLGERLLAVLVPFAHDPAVAANAQRSGLVLAPTTTGFEPRKQPNSVKPASGDSVLDRSTLHAPSQADARRPSASQGTPLGTSTTQEVGPVLLGAHAQKKQGGHGKMHDSAAAPCTLPLVPMFGGDAASQTVTVTCGSGDTVLDLRGKLGVKMGLPLGRVWLAARRDGGRHVLADDAEHADRVACLYRALTRERALELGREFLRHVQEMERLGLISKEIVSAAQELILPKYGFPADVSAILAMLKAFDEHLGDDELAEVGDAINEKLGEAPQAYQVEGVACD